MDDPCEKQSQQGDAHGNQTKIVMCLEKWLKSPMGASVSCDSNGFIPILDAISMCSGLRELAGDSIASVSQAVQAANPIESCVACREDGRAVRLVGLLERIRQAAETCVESKVGSDGISLLDVLRQPRVAQLLEGIQEVSEKVETLKESLDSSKKVQVSGGRILLQQAAWSVSPGEGTSGWWPQMEGSWPTWNEASGTCQSFAPYSDRTPQTVLAMTAWGAASFVMGQGVASLPAGGFGNASDSDTPPMVASPFMPFMAPQAPSGWGSERCTPPKAESPSMPFMAPEASSGWDTEQRKLVERRQWIYNTVVTLLRQAPAELRESMAEDGSVSVSQIFFSRPALDAKLRGNVQGLLRCLQAAGEHGRVAVDTAAGTVRLRSTEERLRAVATMVLGGREKDAAPFSFYDLLSSPEVKLILSEEAASSSDGDAEQAATLRAALETSDLICIVDDVVCWKPMPEILLEQLEELLAEDLRALGLLQKEGQVSLHWLAENAAVRRLLDRAFIKPGKESLDALRCALAASEKFELDGARMSCLLRSPSVVCPRAPAMPALGHEQGRRRRLLPTDKDASDLRKLLKFYFEPFNLQHNRVLMAVVETHRRSGNSSPASRGRVGYLQSKGMRPVFRHSDICKMPRIQKIFEQYDRDASSWLLAAAMQADEAMPVQISNRREGLARGTWAATEVKLELTYPAALRLIETNGQCQEARCLIEPDINPRSTLQALPSHTWLVMSYSVSSDLSQSQSPKAADIQRDIVEGRLDPAAITWESRQQKIKRQLLCQPADIVCIQGLQSIGFSERCSETEPRWFSCDDEPALNHLVHLYREMAKANYAVSFTPTMKLPGSSVVCFGNAVFWKRSRWQLKRRWSVKSAAACVQLSSRSQGPSTVDCPELLVCSCKSVASYARDWGEQLAAAEMAFEICEVRDSVQEAADASGAKPIWCGDFNMEPEALFEVLGQEELSAEMQLLSIVRGDAAPERWRSACWSILGMHPWTSVSKAKAGKHADLILHDQGVRPLAALGGLPDGMAEHVPSLLDFIHCGYPSDHMIQMALFVDSSRQDSVATASYAAKNMKQGSTVQGHRHMRNSGPRSSRHATCSSSDEAEVHTRPPLRRRQQQWKPWKA
eukprot:TRINITY_DN7925_c0_g1_i1.p1 TRINITY_DN7925_c0_g1~~TRINITY_DN7925_c0_g1_i1.p1  ORF type:complete len:1149 (-),score=223.92 TRINITY_DN7925_c0_g1_i1:9-3368(-)